MSDFSKIQAIRTMAQLIDSIAEGKKILRTEFKESVSGEYSYSITIQMKEPEEKHG